MHRDADLQTLPAELHRLAADHRAVVLSYSASRCAETGEAAFVASLQWYDRTSADPDARWSLELARPTHSSSWSAGVELPGVSAPVRAAETAAAFALAVRSRLAERTDP